MNDLRYYTQNYYKKQQIPAAAPVAPTKQEPKL